MACKKPQGHFLISQILLHGWVNNRYLQLSFLSGCLSKSQSNLLALTESGQKSCKNLFSISFDGSYSQWKPEVFWILHSGMGLRVTEHQENIHQRPKSSCVLTLQQKFVLYAAVYKIFSLRTLAFLSSLSGLSILCSLFPSVFIFQFSSPFSYPHCFLPYSLHYVVFPLLQGQHQQSDLLKVAGTEITEHL